MGNDLKIIGPSLKPWIRELDNYASQPNGKTTVGLLSVLQLAETQARLNTHVETGRLLASMEKESFVRKTVGTSKWSGKLAIGKGIRYAKYEIGDFRKGERVDWTIHPEHSDPFDDLEVHYAAIEAVLDSI